MAKKPMIDPVPFCDEWRDWMRNVLQFDESTVKQYSSTSMRGIIDTMVAKLQADPSVQAVLKQRDLMFDALPIMLDKSNSHLAIDMLYRLLSEWSNNHASYSNITGKSASDYASALVCYIEFLDDALNTGQLKLSKRQLSSDKLTKALYALLQGPQVYHQKVLQLTLKLRLASQYRFPGKPGCPCYPIRLIKKMFYATPEGKDWFDKWLEDMVNEIKVHTTQGVFTIGQVDYIEINGYDVFVKLKIRNHKLQVLTETYQSQLRRPRPNPDKMKLKENDTLEDISIDHDESLSVVLDKGQWKALPALSQMINDWRKQKDAYYMKLAKQATEIAADLADDALNKETAILGTIYPDRRTVPRCI